MERGKAPDHRYRYPSVPAMDVTQQFWRFVDDVTVAHADLVGDEIRDLPSFDALSAAMSTRPFAYVLRDDGEPDLDGEPDGYRLPAPPAAVVQRHKQQQQQSEERPLLLAQGVSWCAGAYAFADPEALFYGARDVLRASLAAAARAGERPPVDAQRMLERVSMCVDKIHRWLDADALADDFSFGL